MDDDATEGWRDDEEVENGCEVGEEEEGASGPEGVLAKRKGGLSLRGWRNWRWEGVVGLDTGGWWRGRGVGHGARTRRSRGEEERYFAKRWVKQASGSDG